MYESDNVGIFPVCQTLMNVPVIHVKMVECALMERMPTPVHVPMALMEITVRTVSIILMSQPCFTFD